MMEVEAKLKISSPDKYRKKARNLGKYLGKEKKVDDYYTLEEKGKYPRKSLRIRKMNGFYVVNFKQRIFYDNGVYAKKEVEFKVSDLKGFLSLIDDFGYRKWLRKEKITELYEIKKNFHIEINFVKGLGWFIEVEYLANSQNMKTAKNEVLKIVKKLGGNSRNIEREGYTKMLWNKKT